MTQQPDSSEDRQRQRVFEKQAEISRTVRQLESPNPFDRSAAAQRLGELRGPAEALLRALRDRNQHVRAAAAGALGQADLAGLEAEVAEQLLAAIDDPSDAVCAAAIRSLSQLRVSDAREQIAVCLEDPNLGVVRATITALGRFGHEADAALIEPFLESEKPALRGAAAQALAALNYRPAIPRIIAALEAEMADDLTAAHRKPILSSYAQALGDFRAADGAALLVKLTEGEVGVRSTALRALAKIGVELSAESMAVLSEDPSGRLSAALASALVTSERPPEVEEIRRLLSHPKASLRKAAVELAGRIRDSAAVETVRAMAYADPSPFVRPQAIKALVTLLGDGALPDLLALADDLNYYVREAVAVQLGTLAALPDPAEQALRRLWADARTRAAAETSLLAHDLPLPLASEAPAPLPAKRGGSVIPAAIKPEVQSIVPLLLNWQSSLVTAVGRDAVQVRHALQVLLSAIQLDVGQEEVGLGS